jgi:hypothetical protein
MLKIITLICCGSALFPLSAAGTGSIGGRVVTQGARSASGILVRLDKIREFRKDAAGRLQPFGQNVNSLMLTRPDGSFVFTDVPEGSYYLCALATRAGELNSCEWGTEPAPVRVVSGQTAHGGTLVVRSGVVLRIIMDRALPDDDFSVGLMTDSGQYTRANPERSDRQAGHYVLTAPPATSGSLFIDSPYAVQGATRVQLPSSGEAVVHLTVR